MLAMPNAWYVDRGALLYDTQVCLQVDTKASLITACTMLCGIACIIMGIIGNVPLGMVIGMGLAPYFTYNVVGFHGSGNVRHQLESVSTVITCATCRSATAPQSRQCFSLAFSL